VLKPGETMTEEEAFEFLRGKVGKYKIPKHVQFVVELPKTASGKVQKFLLKEEHQKAEIRSTKS
jgi:fatty-acyl-CoA synthase